MFKPDIFEVSKFKLSIRKSVLFRQNVNRFMGSKVLFSSLLIGIATCLFMATVYASNPGTGYTSQGQELNIRIDEAIQGTTYTPGQPVTVLGTTSIGPLATQTNLLYVVDVSGSTNGPVGQDCDGSGTLDAADDFNKDGYIGDTLDCEISGVIAMNQSLIELDGFSAGVVPFASTAVIADVDPADGEQIFVSSLAADQNNNSLNDLEEVAAALFVSQVGLFTPHNVGGGTSFDESILTVNQAFASVQSSSKVALFLSDGHSNISVDENSPLAQAKASGIVIHTYSVGSGGSGCEDATSLAVIATETGGTCTVVTDPAQLATALTGTPPDEIDRVEVVAGNSHVLTTTLNSIGIWSANVPADFVAFPLPVTAMVYATDGTTVTADLLLEATTSIELIDEPVLDSSEQPALKPNVFLPLFQSR